MLILSEDPHIEVKELAETLIDSVMVKLNESDLAGLVKEMQEYLLSKSSINIKDSFKSAPIVDRTPIKMQREHTKRQASSGSVINRKNELTMNGGALNTRAVSYHNSRAESTKSLDTSLITSRLKDFGISNLFKSFHINEDTDMNNFKRNSQFWTCD